MYRTKPPEKPIRLKVTRAAAMLDVSRDLMIQFMADGIFTVQQDEVGGVRYLLIDELEKWVATTGTPEERRSALAAYRRERGRIQ